jgi:LPXTG-site transpeptidase (sortase) family protein
MRIPLFVQVLPIYLVIASFFAIPVWQHHEAVAQAREAGRFASMDLALHIARNQKIVAGSPDRVVIPHLGIDVEVVEGRYDFSSNRWSVSPTFANFAVNTATPNNQQDQTLIYGHWTPRIFGPTKDLQTSDEAYVYTADNHIFKYRFLHSETIKPTDVAELNKLKGRPGLVLMTCQGTWAQERRLMFFSLVSAS